MEPRPQAHYLDRLLDNAAVVADTWRLAGRWADALTLLRGLDPVAAAVGDGAQASLAVQLARVHLDHGTFAGTTLLREVGDILERGLAQAEAAHSTMLQGALWDAKGYSLHVAFLAAGRSSEPADELPCFQRGLTLRRTAGDQRGIAESLFHIGLVYGVVRQNDVLALPYLEEAYRLAQEVGDRVTTSYAVRHIGFALSSAGDLEGAQAALAESLRLREAEGFVPGVAMALVACALAAKDAGNKAAHMPSSSALAPFFPISRYRARSLGLKHSLPSFALWARLILERRELGEALQARLVAPPSRAAMCGRSVRQGRRRICPCRPACAV